MKKIYNKECVLESTEQIKAVVKLKEWDEKYKSLLDKGLIDKKQYYYYRNLYAKLN